MFSEEEIIADSDVATINDDEIKIYRDVTQAEFREIAAAAGHEKRCTELFLAPGAPVRDYVRIGKEYLRVTDW